MSERINIKFFNIEWETDGEDVSLPSELVTSVEVDGGESLAEIIENEGADILSDQTGWLVNGFEWQIESASAD